MESKFFPPPGAVAQPTEYVPPPPSAEPIKHEGDLIAWTADGSFKAPVLNLLRDIPLKPIAVVPPASVASSGRKLLFAIIGGIVFLALVGGGAFLVLPKKPAPVVIVTAPSLRPVPGASATPSPTVTPSPTATPALAVTQPTVAPTAGHPQSSTVTSTSGLWLRSSATSIDQSNIIGWMPKGAVVSVDSIGPFWWHGTYNGRSGYFASKYTN